MRTKEHGKKRKHTDHEKQSSGGVTSLPASIVSLSLLPSSEPEATIALSMSPVARWQTQYRSASRGACGEEERSFVLNYKLLKFEIIATKQTNEDSTLIYRLMQSQRQAAALLADKGIKVFVYFG